MTRRLFASVSAVAFSLATAVAQQPVPASYYQVSFIKAKPGKLTDYEAFLKKNLPGIAKSQIKDGKWLGWAFANVVTPTGSAEEHDLVGVYAYDKFEQLEPEDAPSDTIKSAIKALGFASPEDYYTKRDALRDIVRSEFWRLRTSTTATAGTASKPGDYVVTTFLKMNPGKEADYLDVWKKYSLPIQEDRVKAGKLKSYSMWSVLGATGTESKYDMVSLARYGSFKDLASEDDLAELDKASEQIHPGKDWRQMRRDMVGLRSVYRSEVIKIQDVVR